MLSADQCRCLRCLAAMMIPGPFAARPKLYRDAG